MGLHLTEQYVRRAAGSRSYERGEEYADTGAVSRLEQIGSKLVAEVEGSAAEPYEVSISAVGRSFEATCTCPYDYGNWCKHIVAAALTAIRHPDAIATGTSLDDALAGLDRDALCALIADASRRDRRARIAIEAAFQRIQIQGGVTVAPERVLPDGIDAAHLRQAVRRAVSTVERAIEEFDDSDPVDGINQELAPVLDGIGRLVEAGRPAAALPALETVTVELLRGMERLEQYCCDAESTFLNIGRTWCEALLTAELSADERAGWAVRLRGWRSDGIDCGARVGLSAAILAAEQGPDYVLVAHVLSGASAGPIPATEKTGAGLLVGVRVDLLERAGRLEEAARLSTAAGMALRHLELLARLGRIDEAVAGARKRLRQPDEFLRLAKVIFEAGDSEAAAQVAEAGLSRREPDHSLAIWLRDVAAETGDVEREMRAGTAIVMSVPTLDDYQELRRLCQADPERWTEIRRKVLALLCKPRSYTSGGAVDILLDEGMVAEALATVEQSWDYATIGRVVEAAITVYPDRALAIARAQAERIMDSGKTDLYHHAAEWLRQARDAFRAAGAGEDWLLYKRQLLVLHGRKYRLVPMLQAL